MIVVFELRRSPFARPLWIPAFAGMTELGISLLRGLLPFEDEVGYAFAYDH